MRDSHSINVLGHPSMVVMGTLERDTLVIGFYLYCRRGVCSNLVFFLINIIIRRRYSQFCLTGWECPGEPKNGWDLALLSRLAVKHLHGVSLEVLSHTR